MPTVPYHPYEGDSDENKKKSSNSIIRSINRSCRRLQNKIGYKIISLKTGLLATFVIVFCIFWFGDNVINSNLSSSFSTSGLTNNPDSKLPKDLINHGKTSWFSFNKPPKIVIILAANEGGGVLRWKNEQEWAIEKISIANKKAYAKRHGYGLTIKDLTTAKRYSHEYRESWQKVDILKQTFREFPDAEWFWWLDLDTFIMEPDRSLESHIFSRVDKLVDRTLKSFNPLGLEVDIPFVDYTQDMDLLITQDCGGFNLGSFLIRNSDWSKLLLDIWWDPAGYEQKHMIWEHREQDALETLYANEAWIRSKVGFLPLRMINSFPPGACSEFSDDSRYFYNEYARDFVVNMAGCNFGRDCWGEMSHYATLMAKTNRKWYDRLFF
ncbi:probable alpha-1,6-mannosyltransferase Mnn10p [Monosporozyma unispora]|nr:alpha-1,6-mannosyltransferase [Kazachstania unispora]